MKSSKLFLFFLAIAGAGALEAVEHSAATVAVDPSKNIIPRDLEGEMYWHIIHCDSESFDGIFTWYLSRIEKAQRPGLIKRLEEYAIKVKDEKWQLLCKGLGYKNLGNQTGPITHEDALKASFFNKAALYGQAVIISGLISILSLAALIPIPSITTAEGHEIQFSVTDKARAKARHIAPCSMILTGVFAYLYKKENSKVKKLFTDLAELDTIIAHINEDHEENCPWAYPLGCELMMLQPQAKS